MKKKSYMAPVLREYGQLIALTRGSGGTKPDQVFNGTGFDLINSACNASAPATACLVPVS